MRTSASEKAGWPTGWAVPAFPHAPQEPPEVVEVPDAFLTRVRKGRLRTLSTPDRWQTGAVHDAEGRLVRLSQKIGGLGGNQLAAADPERVGPRDDVPRLEGTWLYGGHWIHHFGHFVTETVTTLWPHERVDGVVFHAYGRHPGIRPWEQELFDLTGYAGTPVEVVGTAPVRVERLLVPSRSVVVNGWAHPEACQVWDEMVAAVSPPEPRPGDRVFLSRRSFNARRRAEGLPVRTSETRDASLDDAFSAAGFRVVEPETLAIPDQIRLAAGADLLAGCAGTALHLSAFAPAGTRVLEIADSRSVDVPVPHQLVVDCVRKHPSAFVPDAVPARSVAKILRRLGVG